jgi:3-methyladenine DNA glycosylase AlkD
MPAKHISAEEVLQKLETLANPKVRAAMKRFGIPDATAYGISTPVLRRVARETGRNHALAQELWDSGVHEARILAGMIDEPGKVTAPQMERWAREFDSWDVVDGSCCHLFVFAAPAWRKSV